MASWLSNDTVLLDGSCPLPLDLPFTSAIAATLGVSRAQFRSLLARGLVRRVCWGVYAVAQAPDDLDFRARALGLVVSPSAVVTDRTAAWLHGVTSSRGALPRPHRRSRSSSDRGPAVAGARSPVVSGCFCRATSSRSAAWR